ncbi:DUF2809 domain-containing protein [Microbacterium sp. T2.11-28]|uniref:ribosomal maturation YjgA family protein n=1 Tax=Microbacterium sp. T2.11-28 TaxID=3041169 RepID=UPI0024777BAA|nr:DUF2809 domain-containing protein [Microbacterium sp. T2.11-28]CAI9391971.1 hypothetical protein MICABA_01954 [Microbacterium sp. T2.11-28]
MAAGTALTPRRRTRTRTATGRRIAAASALASAVAVGLFVHLRLTGVGGDIAGDVLYAVAVYAGLVAVAPRLSSPVVAAIAGAWCVGVELFQLTGLPAQWGAGFGPAMLVLGTVFDPRDLVVYVATVAIAAVTDVVARRAAARPARG